MESESKVSVRAQCWMRDGRRLETVLMVDAFFETREGSVCDWVTRTSHVVDEFEVSPKDVWATLLEVRDDASGDSYTISERFWAEHPNTVIARRDFRAGTLVYSLSIIEVHTSDGAHILRLEPTDADSIGLIQHTLYTSKDEMIPMDIGLGQSKD